MDEIDQNDTKKADIERRRNEGLKESPNTVIKSTIFKSTDLEGNDIFIKVEHRSDGKIQASISEDGKTFLDIGHPKDLIGRITDSEYAKGIFGNDIIEIGDGGVSKKTDKINAKYDAELKALEQDKKTTEVKKEGIETEIKPEEYAVEEGEIQEGGVGEYKPTDEGRPTPKTGRGDSIEQGGKEEIQKEKIDETKLS